MKPSMRRSPLSTPRSIRPAFCASASSRSSPARSLSSDLAQARGARANFTPADRRVRDLVGVFALTWPSLRLRAKSNFFQEFKLICPVQSGLKKYFAYRFTRNTIISTAVPPLWRGVSRSSRTLVRDAVDAAARLTKRAEADGEVVWS